MARLPFRLGDRVNFLRIGAGLVTGRTFAEQKGTWKFLRPLFSPRLSWSFLTFPGRGSTKNGIDSWPIKSLQQAPGGDKCLPIMLVARDDFRKAEPAERERLFRECLHALLVTGKPPPFWARVWGINPGQEDGRTGPLLNY